MSLTGWQFLVIVVGATVAVLGLTMALWNRWPHGWAGALRLLSLLLVMVCGAALAADLVNAYYGFYQSVGDLLSAPASPDPPGSRPLGPGERGQLQRIRLDGPRSGLNRTAYVYLPAAYAGSPLRFPVIEFFHGYPGGPRDWTHQLNLAHTLDRAIADHRLPPVIAVVPTTYDHGRDSECVDAVQGQQDETYLAEDVPAALAQHYRTLDTPAAWAAVGYSSGAYCAVNLAFHHPERYAAAVSLSGYFTALTDAQTGNLYRGRTDLRQYNSPLWLAQHTATHTPVYLAVSNGDPEAVHAAQALSSALGPTADTRTATLPSGGHNYNVWSRLLPPALTWLGPHLPPARPGSG